MKPRQRVRAAVATGAGGNHSDPAYSNEAADESRFELPLRYVNGQMGKGRRSWLGTVRALPEARSAPASEAPQPVFFARGPAWRPAAELYPRCRAPAQPQAAGPQHLRGQSFAVPTTQIQTQRRRRQENAVVGVLPQKEDTGQTQVANLSTSRDETEFPCEGTELPWPPAHCGVSVSPAPATLS